MCINEINRAIIKISLITDKGNPVKCHQIIISNKGNLNKDRLSNSLLQINNRNKHKTGSNHQQLNNNSGNLNQVTPKADNKWTGRTKTVAREHKTIIGRNNNEVVAGVITDQVEVVADPAEVVVVVEAGDKSFIQLNG